MVIFPPAVSSAPAALPPEPPAAWAAPAPAWQRLLDNKNGWIGSDCACSVRLGKQRTLWLFDDTYVGSIADGRRVVHSPMVRNTVGLQEGLDPAAARVRFVFGPDQAGRHTAFLAPPGGKGWFWFGGGVVAHRHLWLILWKMDAAGQGAFGFKTDGIWLAGIPNYMEPPEQWRVDYRPLPFFHEDAASTVLYGNGTCRAGRWIYVYGYRDEKGTRPLRRSLLTARAPADSLDNPAAWQFLTPNGWSGDWLDGAGGPPEVGAELSVSRLPDRRRYLLVYSPSDLSPEIRLRLARTPAGPWSAAAVAYRCPEGARPGVFCYAARAHPELSHGSSLLVTYATNAFAFQDALRDASLYFPQFVSITIREAGATHGGKNESEESVRRRAGSAEAHRSP